jgi:LacI family transcriptional regulator
MAITAKDIAIELGLSQSTVSRILNGDSRQRISPHTRKRVLDAAERHQYRPNALASALRRGRTNVIGLYTNQAYDARNDFLSHALAGIQHGCRAEALDLLLPVGTHTRSPEEIYRTLMDGRIDGVLIHTSPEDPVVEMLTKSGIPVVSLADPSPDIEHLPCITADDIEGMQQLTRYLLAHGRQLREAGVAGCNYVFIDPAFKLTSVEWRKFSWRNTLAAAGVVEQDCITMTVPDEDTAAADWNMIEHLLETRPTAISCWNDRTAYSLLQQMILRYGSLPSHVAVTGFDGFLDNKLPAHRLTTVDCGWADIASQAVSLLSSRINGNDIPLETHLPAKLIEGTTA